MSILHVVCSRGVLLTKVNIGKHPSQQPSFGVSSSSFFFFLEKMEKDCHARGGGGSGFLPIL